MSNSPSRPGAMRIIIAAKAESPIATTADPVNRRSDSKRTVSNIGSLRILTFGPSVLPALDALDGFFRGVVAVEAHEDIF